MHAAAFKAGKSFHYSCMQLSHHLSFPFSSMVVFFFYYSYGVLHLIIFDILLYFQRAPFLSRHLTQLLLLAWTGPLAFHIVSAEQLWGEQKYVGLTLVSVSVSST